MRMWEERQELLCLRRVAVGSLAFGSSSWASEHNVCAEVKKMCPHSLLSCQRNPVNRSRARGLTEIRRAPLIIKPRVIATALQDLKPSAYCPQTVKNMLSQTTYFNTS